MGISCEDCQSRTCSVLRDSASDLLSKIDGIKTTRSYKKGEQLFEEGKHPRGLICVKNGKIKVYQRGAEGKEQILHMIKDGDIMGHRALLSDDTYSCSAIALEDVEVCFIPKTRFNEILQNDTGLTLRIAHLLAHELKEAERNITYATQESVLNRLVKTLLFLQSQFGFREDGQTLNIELWRDDLSDLVGTTRESTTRSLSKLQDQNLIALEGKGIKIIDLTKLKSLLS